MNILSIETSCDDTCCSITKNGILVANNRICNESLYRNSSGVIPVLASEQHFQEIDLVIKKTLTSSKNLPIDFVAFTKEPGLKPSLLIGEVAASTIAKITGAQLIPINHLYGHCFSILINETKIFQAYPVLAIVISGGHTTLFQVNSPKDFIVIAETTDDSIGECFDKIGSKLGFDYPAGRYLDEYIVNHKMDFVQNEEKYSFPVFQCKSSRLRFSFSGLKSHCVRILNTKQIKENLKIQFVYEFFISAFKQIVHVLKYAQKQYKISEIWISGGVSASKCLREYLSSVDFFKTCKIRFPKIMFSADNAAMIGCLAYNRLKYSC